MPDSANPPAKPAGWYPDPTGAPQQRWWNGESWEMATMREDRSAVETGSALARRPRLTLAIWILAAGPMIFVAGVFVASLGFGYDAGPVAVLFFALAALGGSVVLMAWDAKDLQRLGLEPLYDGRWSLSMYRIMLLAYVPLRTIAVFRQTGHGRGPVVFWIMCMAVAIWIGARTAIGS